MRGVWRLRLGWASAWGAPVDLSSCASPLPGLALPRHWGHWDEEQSVGLARAGRRLTFGLAVCRRTPSAAAAAGLEVWQQGSVAW